MQPALKPHLFDEVLAAPNLKRAWKQCEKQLRSRNYHPSPVRRVEIDKPDSGKHLLGIPTVLDRVIQQAITQVLSPIFEPTFSDNSFGFRPREPRLNDVEVSYSD